MIPSPSRGRFRRGRPPHYPRMRARSPFLRPRLPEVLERSGGKPLRQWGIRVERREVTPIEYLSR
jgi:hypothetical protein